MLKSEKAWKRFCDRSDSEAYTAELGVYQRAYDGLVVMTKNGASEEHNKRMKKLLENIYNQIRFFWKDYKASSGF